MLPEQFPTVMMRMLAILFPTPPNSKMFWFFFLKKTFSFNFPTYFLVEFGEIGVVEKEGAKYHMQNNNLQ